MILDTENAQIVQKQNMCNSYAILREMWTPSYYHNDFVATHLFGHMMYGYTLLEHKSAQQSKQ